MHLHSPQPPTRRSFLDWCIHGLGAVLGGILGFPVIAYLIDPRNRPNREGAFKTVARLNDLPVGVPVQAVVRDTKRDAWTLYPDEVIGRVWLVRRDDKKVEAYTTICPHLGCSINCDGKKFVCPCHNGTFHLSGERMSTEELGTQNPAPRSMDQLEVKFDETDPNLVQVKYEDFQQGRHEKVPK